VATGEEKTLVAKIWLTCDSDDIIVRCEVPWECPLKISPRRVKITPAPNSGSRIDPFFEYAASEDSEERVIVIDLALAEYAII